MFTNKM